LSNHFDVSLDLNTGHPATEKAIGSVQETCVAIYTMIAWKKRKQEKGRGRKTANEIIKHDNGIEKEEERLTE
jgi:hypothetical protein